MKKVAWVSRHPPLKSQVEALKQKLGDVQIIHIAKTFTDYKEVLNAVKEAGAKYAVVVLPLSMISLLTEDKDITWLYAIMGAVHDGCIGENCLLFNPETDVIMPPNRHLRFFEFKKIKEVRMVLEDWE